MVLGTEVGKVDRIGRAVAGQFYDLAIAAEDHPEILAGLALVEDDLIRSKRFNTGNVD